MSTQIHPSAVVESSVELGTNVTVGAFAHITGNVKIGDNSKILNHAVIDGRTTLGKNCEVMPFATIGLKPQDLKYKGEDTELIIGDGCQLREYCSIQKGTALGGGATRLGKDCLIMNYCHIGHDCQIGDRLIFSAYSAIAGHVQVEDDVTISGFAGVVQHIRIGKYSMIGAFTVVHLDIAPFIIATGIDCRVLKVNKVRLERAGIELADQKIISQIYRIFFKQSLGKDAALAKITQEFPDNQYAKYFVSFVSASKTGFHR